MGFPQLKEWAIAGGLPQMVSPAEREKIVEKYLTAQENFLARQDPEKLLKMQQTQAELQQKQQAVSANLPAAEALDKNTTAQAKNAAQFDVIAKDQATVEDMQSQLAHINGVATDPNLASALGLSTVFPIIPGSARAGVQAKIDQIGGQAFLDAIPSLKGIGRITEMEANNAKAALSRATNVRQSPADFKESLKDFSQVVQNVQARSRAAMLRNPAYPAYLAAAQATASAGQDPAVPSASSLAGISPGTIVTKMVNGSPKRIINLGPGKWTDAP
jgi:hypothetical protein